MYGGTLTEIHVLVFFLCVGIWSALFCLINMHACVRVIMNPQIALTLRSHRRGFPQFRPPIIASKTSVPNTRSLISSAIAVQNAYSNGFDYHYSDVTWASWSLKSLITTLFVQQLVQASCCESCQIWTWYSIGNVCFDKGWNRENNEMEIICLVTATPGWEWLWGIQYNAVIIDRQVVGFCQLTLVMR